MSSLKLVILVHSTLIIMEMKQKTLHFTLKKKKKTGWSTIQVNNIPLYGKASQHD